MPVDDILQHRDRIDFPLMAVQVVTGCFNIWQILVVVHYLLHQLTPGILGQAAFAIASGNTESGEWSSRVC